MSANDNTNASLSSANFGYADAMKWLRLASALLLALSLGCLTQLSGCAGPSYYAQAIAGHLHLMRSRVPISDLLADPGTDPELARQLRQTLLMRQFAGEKLFLPTRDNYSRVTITGKDAVTWNVVAAPEFSIEPRLWCFPVAGCVAYRGYFDRQRAEDFAGRMAKKSFDVMVSPAVAYSTLGWFDDPLLDTMLKYSEASLAGIIFHELAHERLYVSGDTNFNEAFAGFVEQTGVRLWLSDSGRSAELGQWEARKRASMQFNGLLKETREQLRAVYSSGQPEETMRQEKKHIFESLRARYRVLVADDWYGTDYFASWMDGDLNNAYLALMDSYEGGICAFAALFRESGENLQKFYALAAEKAALEKKIRQAWLDGACVQIASDVEL